MRANAEDPRPSWVRREEELRKKRKELEPLKKVEQEREEAYVYVDNGLHAMGLAVDSPSYQGKMA